MKTVFKNLQTTCSESKEHLLPQLTSLKPENAATTGSRMYQRRGVRDVAIGGPGLGGEHAMCGATKVGSLLAAQGSDTPILPEYLQLVRVTR